MMKHCRAALLLMIAASVLLGAAASAEQRDSTSNLERLLDLIPADALAVIGAPNLRSASDALSQQVEAMDRGHLLLGSRPIDQLKAMLGFSVGVNDLGGAAVVLAPALPSDNVGEHASVQTLALENVIGIVAVTNADDFLAGNFVSAAPSADSVNVYECKHARWGTVHARVIGRFVALSPRAEHVQQLGEDHDDASSFVANRLGAEGLAIAKRGEVFAYLHQSACDLKRLGMWSRLLKLTEHLPRPSIESITISVDFDPLGMFVRGRTVFPVESEAGRLSTAIAARRNPDAADRPELAVPDRPFIMVGGIAASVITPEIASIWTGKDWVKRVLDALVPARAADFAVYPAQGYALNESILVLRGENGRALADLLHSFIAAHESERTNIVWNENRFEMRVSSPSQSEAAMIRSLFGPAGVRGVIGRDGNAAFLVPSHRQATIEIAERTAQNRDDPLSRNHVVQSMQAWLPSPRDVELYVDPAQFRQLLNFVPFAGNYPRFQPDQPPIGFGMKLMENAAEYTVIFPSNVLAPVLDSQIDSLKQRSSTPRQGGGADGKGEGAEAKP